MSTIRLNLYNQAEFELIHCIRLTATRARDMDWSKQDLQATLHKLGPPHLLQLLS